MDVFFCRLISWQRSRLPVRHGALITAVFFSAHLCWIFPPIGSILLPFKALQACLALVAHKTGMNESAVASWLGGVEGLPHGKRSVFHGRPRNRWCNVEGPVLSAYTSSAFFFLFFPPYTWLCSVAPFLWVWSLIGLFNKQSKDDVSFFYPPHTGEKPVM